MEDYSKYVPNVIFEQIPIKNLVSSEDYQRNLSTKHVKKAVENCDMHQINPVKVSRRNGINYVFNGQHTIEIVATVSGSRDTPVWCMVYDDLYYEHDTGKQQRDHAVFQHFGNFSVSECYPAHFIASQIALHSSLSVGKNRISTADGGWLIPNTKTAVPSGINIGNFMICIQIILM